MSEKVGELEYTKEEALIYGATYYEEAEGGEPGVKEAEPVELLLLEEKSALEDSEDDAEEEGELDLSVYKSIEVEARLVAGRINELIKSGFLVFDKEIKGKRPVTYRDIVILMRATSRTANIFLEALHENNIPSYSDSSTGYFDTIEIRTILSLLKVIDNPLQDIPLLSVLRSPLFSFSEEELVEIRKVHKDEFLFHNLKNGSFEIALSEKVNDFMEKLELYRLKSRFMKLDEFIWYLYTDTSYLDYVSAMPDGLERQANLKLLFQRARQFEETTLKGLFNFIRFIDKLKKSSGDYGAAKMLGENENLVRIMSIHKSKGLEFPVVFLVHTSKRFNKMDLNKSMILHESLGFG
ncbi:3'-5' exonuclease, partial [Proteiniclasticum sp.]|uniref:3'-5' exonuclease n=1 Tax=Proteiniclasticum sp. TaxID=2053595 RepID=UPI00289B717E